ncbi:actin-related protein 2/3 complex subunit 3-A-like [Ciona intestinalis]|uniref:Actin-related protein 2/3 complex subunit 3 n=1 Tax=Ciona intestinalis TaxID=7719 RepID=F6T6F5_CIOIN|nr:actin-related protein 2/3 complex subunit 3-like [Ciona intestinalis]|eukprot:XP_002127960.1 actin-related protein 2/3 complex subunit 3-like [Ciona intestinalis]
MPAYHSAQTFQKSIGNLALVPIKCPTKYKGPAPRLPNDATDIIDETIGFFRANIFFRNYDIKSDADRTLIYITLYIQECLKKLQRCANKEQGRKELYTLAVSPYDIPGDPGFPLNAMYSKPQSRAEADQMKAYIGQLRLEIGDRLLEKVIDQETGKPSKWWMCYSKRKFMEKSLSAPGK